MFFSRQSLLIISFVSTLIIFSDELLANNHELKSQGPATMPMLCPIPTYKEIATGRANVTDDTINIFSKYASIERDLITQFSGGVTLIDKSQKILADELAFNRLSMELKAIGNIHYQSNNINIFADALSASKAQNSTTMTSASYQLDGNPGHGSAAQLLVTTDGQLNLIDSTFTTCLDETPDWQIKASEINLSATGDFGEAYHAQFRVLDVPVLYIPYFSFPVSQKRTTGFLYPKISSSSNSGLEVETPFYWNIAENYDATITPHYMSKRGLQLQTEFRYLVGLQAGQIDIEYLNKDKALKANDDPRYLARLQHVGTFSDNFRAYVDYTTMSDDNYLVDIGSRQYNSNDAYLYQIGELAYFGENWQTTFKLQDFEVLGNHQPSYKTLPHIEIAAQQPLNFLSSQLELYSELSSFQSAEENQVEANRYHVEAGLTLPVSTPAWFFNSELRLMHTYYQQDNIQLGSDLEDTVQRTLPKVRFHGGINFDRQMTAFGSNYRHTFEPQLQYLYIPDKDQSNIGLYDTTNLQDDFNGLFRDRRFSGLDRIAGANQYTWGITSRILDESNLEVFRLSVGRIQYLSENEKSQDSELLNLSSTSFALENQESSVAADVFYRINHQWQISGDIQYNTQENFTNKGQVNLDYQFNKYNTVQLNHRYARNVSGNSLEQVSLLTSVAINTNWAFVGRLTQDLRQSRSLESYAGFQYESCCWAIRLAYHRHINSNLDDEDFINENRDEFDSGIMVQFIIKGLDGKQSAIGTQEMFNDSIFGYKRPYYLNN
ncbi:LPS assembly protein LptD [Litorilituus sediminis]|uniref:LPS-assembly protein LptD n=1 Tax=Litorilituus sediminis TaxID=718192 RepID=A0A4P6P611_9GAMM|nr:LPS assembly protein LptD [Litorilituus sediminis]QBG36943.1 LPS-assembly protein LptD [Litorilituus sediminis]